MGIWGIKEWSTEEWGMENVCIENCGVLSAECECWWNGVLGEWKYEFVGHD